MKEIFSENCTKLKKRQAFDDSLLSLINCISKNEINDSNFMIKIKNPKDENIDIKMEQQVNFEKNYSDLETFHNGDMNEEN